MVVGISQRSLAFALALAQAACASRGQASYTLPEMQIASPVSNARLQQPLWSRAVDSDRGDFLPGRKSALGENVVAFRFHGHVCGFSVDTGEQKWCAGSGDGPVYAAHQFAYTDNLGVIQSVDAQNGAVKWRFSFSSRARDLTVPRELAWATPSDFLIARVSDPSGGAPNLGEVSDGELLWSSRIPGYYSDYNHTLLSGPYALWYFGPAGRGSAMEVIRLGRGGGVRRLIDGGGWIVGARFPTVFATGRWHVRSSADFALTFEVRQINLRTGQIGKTFHYEPDYSQNYERIKNTLDWLRGPTRAAAVKVENGFVYGTVAGRLYRYALADGNGQRPLEIAGAYLSGPTRNVLLVARSDGIWSLRIGAHAIRVQRVVSVESNVAGVQAMATLGDVTYIALSDGRLLGIDLTTGRTVFQAKTCHVADIRTDGRHIVVVCYFDFAWQVAVFRLVQ